MSDIHIAPQPSAVLWFLSSCYSTSFNFVPLLVGRQDELFVAGESTVILSPFPGAKRAWKKWQSSPEPYPQEWSVFVLHSLRVSLGTSVQGQKQNFPGTRRHTQPKMGTEKVCGWEGRLGETEVPVSTASLGRELIFFLCPSHPQALGYQHWPRFPALLSLKQPRHRQHVSPPHAELWWPVNAEHSRHFLQFIELMRPLGASAKMTAMY